MYAVSDPWGTPPVPEQLRREEAALPARDRRRLWRERFKVRRRAYLASKPRCWCGRVGVESGWAFFPDTGESKREWACRAHREQPDDFDGDDDCMCEWPRTCGGLGSIECRGCGGDNCVCICRGGPIECDGCRDCNYGREDGDDQAEDDYPF